MKGQHNNTSDTENRYPGLNFNLEKLTPNELIKLRIEKFGKMGVWQED
jgi:hypothetical protein